MFSVPSAGMSTVAVFGRWALAKPLAHGKNGREMQPYTSRYALCALRYAAFDLSPIRPFSHPLLLCLPMAHSLILFHNNYMVF